MKRLVSTLFLVALSATLFTSQASGQYTWTKRPGNPIFSSDALGSWYKAVWSPSILYNPDSSRYEMWFSAGPGSEHNWVPYQIAFAVSRDGLSWTLGSPTPVLTSVPGTWEYNVANPSVIRENGVYKMWYSGIKSFNGTDSAFIGYATSPDGIHWTRYAGNPVLRPGPAAWEFNGIGDVSVVKIGSVYTMWYDGGPTTSATIGRIGRATSTDGIHWTKDDVHNPILDMGTAGQWDQGSLSFPRVFVVRDTLFMCYTCVKSNGNWRAIGLARSTDGGTVWQKIGTGPILSSTAYGWDQSFVQEGFVLPMGNELYMWYFGISLGANKGSIGIATSPNPGALVRVPQDYKSIQAGIDAAFDGDTVLVSEGTYTENIVLTKKITVGSLFVVDGDTAHVARTVIDGSQPHTLDSAAVVTIDGNTDTTTVVAGFTLTGGKGNWRHVNWPPIVYDMRLGTGVDVAGGGAHIHHNIIRANNVNDPSNPLGGVVNIFDVSDKNGISYVVVDHNTVSDNVLVGKDCEGGAFVVIHDASIYANIIERNSATGVSEDGYGAAFLIQNGTVKVDGNLIVGNAASHLGGAFTIYSVGIVGAVPHVTLTNNIVAHNSAGKNGGGMYVGGSDVIVAMINNTFASNSAVISGSGITIDSATVRGLNTILWDPGKPEIQMANGHLFASYCDILGGYTGTGNIDADPMFVVGDPMFNLQTKSPCIGRAVDSMQIGDVWYRAPSRDIDGDPRHMPAGPQALDIGAQEEQVTVDVAGQGPGMPTRFALEQNYPNPFNPVTTIAYWVGGTGGQGPGASNVRLVVYDIVGRELAVLVNEKKAPGSYEVEFDARGLSSGIYFYRLTAGKFVETRKMILVR